MTERAFYERGAPSDRERSWLERLEPGDQVIVQEHGRDRLGTLEQRLPSGRLLVTWEGGTHEFNFAGRLRTSGTYTAIFLVEPTPYRKGMLEKQQLASYLAEQEWLRMPLETLRQLVALVQDD